MARGGQHRFAQAYAKNWNRKMRKHAAEDEQAYAVSNAMNSNFNQMYEMMGAQDNSEQLME